MVGNLRLISPTYVNALGNLFPIVSTFSTLPAWVFVPEPSAVLLAAFGAGGLFGLRRGRRERALRSG